MNADHLAEAKRAARNIEHVGVSAEREDVLGILHALIAIAERLGEPRVICTDPSHGVTLRPGDLSWLSVQAMSDPTCRDVLAFRCVMDAGHDGEHNDGRGRLWSEDPR